MGKTLITSVHGEALTVNPGDFVFPPYREMIYLVLLLVERQEQTLDQPITIDTQIKYANSLPQGVDVAIIGGGVIGVFTALYLARSGKSVAVLEKGRIAGEQSSRNWGWIRQQGRDAAEFPIVMEAKRLWADIDQELGGATGFHQGGITYLASNQEKLEAIGSWLDVAEAHQLETRFLSKAEMDALIERPGNAGKQWVGALHTPSDARAEPWKAVPAIAELARSEGVSLHEDCAVRALDVAGGKLKGVITEKGRLSCEQVVVCAGAWSSLFLKRHGHHIPQLSVQENVVQTVPLPKFLEGGAADEKLSFRRREDGGYSLALNDHNTHYIGRDSFRNFFTFGGMLRENLFNLNLKPGAPSGFPDAWTTARSWSEDDITPFERCRVLSPQADKAAVKRMVERFAERFPSVGKPQVVRSWAGMIDTMPDLVPVVDRIPELDGVIVATGMSGHGFGIGPGMAKAVCAMANGRPVGHDMQRFRYSRFSDGSKLEPGPHI